MAAPPAASASRFPWLRLAIGLLLLAGVGLRVALPEAARQIAETEASKALGRVVRIGDVDLGLLTGRIEVEELAVLEPIGTLRPPDQLSDPPILSLLRGRANLEWTDLLSQRVRLRELELEGATATFKRRRDGSIVPLVMADATANEPSDADEPEAESASAEPWPVLLDQLVLRQAQTILLMEGEEATQILAVGVERLSVADVFVQGPDIRLGAVDLERPDATLIPDLLLVPAAPASQEGTPSPPLPGLVVERLAIDGARFALHGDEEPLELVLHAAAEELKLPSPFPVDVRLEVGDEGAFVEAKGRARVFSPSFDGSLEWAGLDLARLRAAAGLALPLALESGQSEGRLDVDFSLPGAGAPPAFEARGRIGVRRFSSRGPKGAPDLEAGALDLELEQLALERGDDAGLRIAARGALRLDQLGVEVAGPMPAGVAVERIEIGGAEARVPLDAPEAASLRLGSLRIERPEGHASRRASPTGPDAAESEGATRAERPDLRIGQLELVGGIFDWRDEAVTPPFETRIDQIALRAEGVDWRNSTADLEAEARGPGAAHTRLAGSVERQTGEVDLDLEGLDLALLGPYLADTPWGGVRGGSLELHTRAELDPERIDARNELLLYQLGIGNSSAGFEDAVGVPLDLAAALLKRSDGTIRLEPRLQVERGTTSLQPIIRSALAAALQGAVAVPLKAVTGTGGRLIAALPGTGRKGEGLIAMRPGEAEVPTAGVPSLAQLAKALEKFQRFGVEVSGRSGPADDSAGDGSGGPRGAALARARAERVKQLLVDDYGVDPRRIRLTEPVEGKPGVRLDLVRMDEALDPAPGVAAPTPGAEASPEADAEPADSPLPAP